MEDQNNPVFLHPFDSYGLQLVSQQLTGDNYNSWKRAMVMTLIAKNKLGFMDGAVVAPDRDAYPNAF